MKVQLVKILAPFIPFMTETIYQNLVRSVRPEAYESVHHTAWPQVDPTALDESLLEQMELARQVASLGFSARNAAGLKVRQPLARVLVYAGGRRSLTPELVDIVALPRPTTTSTGIPTPRRARRSGSTTTHLA